MLNFWHLPVTPILKNSIISFRYVDLSGKNLSNFVTPAWKLNNPYYHTAFNDGAAGELPETHQEMAGACFQQKDQISSIPGTIWYLFPGLWLLYSQPQGNLKYLKPSKRGHPTVFEIDYWNLVQKPIFFHPDWIVKLVLMKKLVSGPP